MNKMIKGSDAALVETSGGVMVITLNRPETRNAVNADVSRAVGDALELAQLDTEVRVVVIAGSSGTFCSGADLKAIAQRQNIFHPDRPEWGFGGFVQHFISKPTIAAVNGFALGGGTEMALASDLIVAQESALFGLPEVSRGLIAGAGGLFRMVDQVPRKVALELLFTGRSLTAEEALGWGLINRVVPDTSETAALDAAMELAERIARNAPLAVQASKRVACGIDDGIAAGESDAWRRTNREVGAILKSEDAREGSKAFAQKRDPIWKSC